jgi:hypothetical protein
LPEFRLWSKDPRPSHLLDHTAQDGLEPLTLGQGRGRGRRGTPGLVESDLRVQFLQFSVEGNPPDARPGCPAAT